MSEPEEDREAFRDRLNRQTSLISGLEDGLKESRRRLADMEASVASATIITTLDGRSSFGPLQTDIGNTSSIDQSILGRLTEERGASESLRRELDEARLANYGLTGDCLQLTHQCDNLKREVQARREEQDKLEQLYLDRLSEEHRNMLAAWRSVQHVRREYEDLRSMVTTSLVRAGADLQRVGKGAQAACRKVVARMSADLSGLFPLDDDDSIQEITAEGQEDIHEVIKSKVTRIMATLTDKETTIANLERRLEEAMEQKRSIESRLIDKHQVEMRKIEQLLSECKQRADTELRSISDRADRSEAKSADLCSRLADAERSLSSVRVMLAESEDRTKNLTGRLEITGEQLERTKQRLEAALREKVAAEDALREANQRFKQKEEELRAQQMSLKQSANRDRTFTEEALRAMESQNGQLNQTVAQLQAQLAKVERAHGNWLLESKQAASGMELELTRLRKAEAVREADCRRARALEEENKRLRDQMEKYSRLRRQFVASAIRDSLQVEDLRVGLGESVRRFETSLSISPRPGSSAGSNGGVGSPVAASTPSKQQTTTSADRSRRNSHHNHQDNQ